MLRPYLPWAHPRRLICHSMALQNPHDPVNVVRHNNELVRRCVREMAGNLVPHLLHEAAHLRLTEDEASVVRTDRQEVGAGRRVIVMR